MQCPACHTTHKTIDSFSRRIRIIKSENSLLSFVQPTYKNIRYIAIMWIKFRIHQGPGCMQPVQLGWKLIATGASQIEEPFLWSWPEYLRAWSSCSLVFITSIGWQKHASMTPPRDPAFQLHFNLFQRSPSYCLHVDNPCQLIFEHLRLPAAALTPGWTVAAFLRSGIFQMYWNVRLASWVAALALT